MYLMNSGSPAPFNWLSFVKQKERKNYNKYHNRTIEQWIDGLTSCTVNLWHLEGAENISHQRFQRIGFILVI